MTSILVKDRCWSVPIVAACCAFVISFTYSSSGLMYVLFMEEFHISHEQAAWPQSTNIVLGNSIGFLLSVLQQKLTVYHIILISATLASTGLIASSFAPDIIWRTVLLGGINGAASGMLIMSLSLYTLTYFERYRATATAFKYTGLALSGIVGPSLLNYLAENYGCKGSLLLAGGIAANAIPFVMLLNNPQPFDLPACCRRRKVRDSIPDQAAASLQTVKAASLALMPALNTISRRERAGEEPDSLGSLKQPSIMEVSNKDTVSERNQLPSDTQPRKSEYKSQAPAQGNSLPGHAKAGLHDDRKHQDKPLMVRAPNFLAYCGTLLRSGTLYVLLVCYVMIDSVAEMHATVIVDYGVDKKAGTLAQCNQLQTFSAVGQLSGRLVVPFISDKMPLSRCAFTSANLLIVAACLFLTSVVEDYVTLSLLTAAIGICEGYLLCIKAVLVGEYLGVESLGLFSGLQGIFMAPVTLSGPALIGFFRDTMGSYDRFYWLLAALNVVAAFLICSIAVADRFRQKTWKIDHGSNF